MKTDLSQKGSVLFIILIAVVLFAALAFTVGQMMRGGNPDTITLEKSRLFGNDILNYARSMSQAAQNMKISNGCTDADISFENATLTGYEHTPAVSDACKMFNNAGGGMVYQPPMQEWLDMSPPAIAGLRGQWFFPARTCVTGTGTAEANCSTDGVANEAIIAVLPYLKKELCLQINKLLGVANPGDNPPAETSNAWTATSIKYTGVMADGEKIEQSGRMAGCFEGATASIPNTKTYHFFQVLIPR